MCERLKKVRKSGYVWSQLAVIRRIVQGAWTNQPGGERARGRIVQGRNGKGAKKPDTIAPLHRTLCVSAVCDRRLSRAYSIAWTTANSSRVDAGQGTPCYRSRHVKKSHTRHDISIFILHPLYYMHRPRSSTTGQSCSVITMDTALLEWMAALKMLDVKLQDTKMQNMKMYWHILHRHDKHEKQTFFL